MKKVPVVYFFRSGNTKKLARVELGLGRLYGRRIVRLAMKLKAK